MNHKKVLQKIEQKLKHMEEIEGIFYTGSTATGKLDEFSDLDICLVSNENVQKTREKIFFSNI